MRERKCRAWHPKHKKMYAVKGWMQGDYGSQDLCVYCIDEQGVTQRFADGMTVLMDYTGVTDCNGEEICESDIVTIAHTSLLIQPGTIGVVNYANGRYVIDTHAHTHGLNLFVDRRYRRYGKPYIEIVGNLWETPHLAPRK